MIELIPDPVLEGRTWIFPDGTRIPLVSGGSDIQTFDQAAAGAFGGESGGDTGSAGAPPADATPGAAPAGVPAAPPDGASQGYIKHLQDESYNYRQQAAQFRQAAEGWEKASRGWHPDDRSVILQAIELGATDPSAAANVFLQVAAALQQQGATPPPPPQPLTEQRLMEIFQQRDMQEKVQAETRTIQQEATELGFPPGTPAYGALLNLAHNQFDNDLGAAAEAIRALAQQMRDQSVADYNQQKQAQAGQLPPAAPQGAQGTPSAEPPKTIAEAEQKLRASLGQ